MLLVRSKLLQTDLATPKRSQIELTIVQADVLQLLRLQQERIDQTEIITNLVNHLLVLQIERSKEVTIEVLPKHTAQVEAVEEVVSLLEVLEAAEAEKEETNIGFN